MRDFLYITGLMTAVFMLAADFPAASVAPGVEPPAGPVFASFTELSPSLHAACLDAAKTSWQVRSGSRARPVIGSLDAGVPLLNAALPPPEKVVFAELAVDENPAGVPETDVYSLLPASAAADCAVFTPQPVRDAASLDTQTAFPKKEMLSTDDFIKLKEIMQ